MLGTPVAVVFFKIPVANPDKAVPLICFTVVALPTLVTSPVKSALTEDPSASATQSVLAKVAAFNL